MRAASRALAAAAALAVAGCSARAGASVRAAPGRATSSAPGAGQPVPAASAAAIPQRLYGINVEPGYRPWRWSGGPNPDSWWDPVRGPARLAADLPLARSLGVSLVRVEFPWTFLEPQRGRFDWSRADTIVAQAARNSVQLQPVLVYCPSWEGPPACVPDADDFASFTRAVVGRYRGSIHYWEMWNESDSARYFAGSEAQYVQDVLDPGYDAVKATDPSARVVLSGQWDTSRRWIAGLFSGGARFDVAAYHDYSGTALAANATAIRIKGWLAAGGFRGPLWLSEFGLQEAGITDRSQIDYLRGVVQSDNPASAVMWYNLRDDDVFRGPSSVDHAEYYGLVTRDLKPKLGLAAFMRLISSARGGR